MPSHPNRGRRAKLATVDTFIQALASYGVAAKVKCGDDGRSVIVARLRSGAKVRCVSGGEKSIVKAAADEPSFRASVADGRFWHVWAYSDRETRWERRGNNATLWVLHESAIPDAFPEKAGWGWLSDPKPFADFVVRCTFMDVSDAMDRYFAVEQADAAKQ